MAFPKSIMGKFWSIIGSGLIYSPTLMWKKKLSGCGLLCAHVHVVEERVKMEHHVSSVIRGHHVSKSFWTPAIDEIATAITEDSNTFCCGAVSVRPWSSDRRSGEARIEGQSRECGGSEARRCGSGDVHRHIIIAPAPSRKH